MKRNLSDFVLALLLCAAETPHCSMCCNLGYGSAVVIGVKPFDYGLERLSGLPAKRTLVLVDI
jgi:hypothetical protein